MSQAKLTLRPPPNIDFVQGYPGIPPGPPDRPQAAVKGAIEVRVGPQGVKAKWVRIELRKIETLPGGGLTNTFFDFVGQSPISLWQSGEEYSTLSSQDFPFNIRIPESIPPSIALEKGAGIKYELIATLCVKGKKGFLKRDKANVIATSAPIIIDKHELHSTWPVYTQPEGRKLTQEGVTLTVERTHTCFGPGDRIYVTAIVRSDSLSTVILRGFEFALRETTVFRAGPHMTGKKGAPQVKVSHVGEQKVPVNATLYGGTQHKAELSVTVPSHHTTTTLNAARHIDITYVLIVKALMGTGKPLVIDLPVVISNWPRAVSVEAVRRIGMAPNVQSQSQAIQGQPALQIGSPISPGIGQQIIPSVAASAAVTPSIQQPRPSISNQAHPYASLNDRPATNNSDSVSAAARFNTTPAMLNGGGNTGSPYRNTADEFGFHSSRTQPTTLATTEVLQIGGSSTVAAGSSSGANRAVASDTSSNSGGHTANTNTSTPAARQRTSDRAPAPTANRLTVTNFNEDIPDEAASQAAAVAAAANARAHQRQTSLTVRPNPVAPAATVTSGSRSNGGWVPAEEEKRRLYERAVADVERVQGGLVSPPAQAGHVDAGRVMSSQEPVPMSPPPSSSKWPTAEEEKARLFNEAQAAARRMQGIDPPLTPPGTAAGGSSSGGLARNTSTTAPVSPQLTGAALYAQAMSSVNRHASAGHSSAGTPNRRFPTAEEEKAELRRYHEAKAAVERNQMAMQDAGPISEPPPTAPISYEALYGPGPPGSPTRQSKPPNGSANGYGVGMGMGMNSPPTFADAQSATSPMSAFDALSEKERLRKAYEAQDAMAAAAAVRSPASTVNNVPTYPTSAQAPAYSSAPSSAQRPMTPQGLATMSPTPMSAPLPGPGHASAISEKELLRLRYEAQDAAAASGPPYTPPMAQMANGASPGGPTPTPPPRTRGSPGGGSLRGALPNPRSPPLPPSSSASSPLSAAEEKARLRAMYDAQDNVNSSPSPPRSQTHTTPPPSQHPYAAAYAYTPPSPTPAHSMQPMYTNGNGMNGASVQRQGSMVAAGIPPPPPLAPRPPREYIEETREEDARTHAKLKAMDSDPNLRSYGNADDHSTDSSSPSRGTATVLADPHLSIKPFTPFTPGFDLSGGALHDGSRPPLPTKVGSYDQ